MEAPPDISKLLRSIGAARRLRQVMLSSAFTPEERTKIMRWLDGPTATEDRVATAILWAVNLAQSHDRNKAPLNNRIASVTEKLAYRLDELERDPTKAIRPILSKRDLERMAA